MSAIDHKFFCECTGAKTVLEVYPEQVGACKIVVDAAVVEKGTLKKCKVKCHECGQVGLLILPFPAAPEGMENVL